MNEEIVLPVLWAGCFVWGLCESAKRREGLCSNTRLAQDWAPFMWVWVILMFCLPGLPDWGLSEPVVGALIGQVIYGFSFFFIRSPIEKRREMRIPPVSPKVSPFAPSPTQSAKNQQT